LSSNVEIFIFIFLPFRCHRSITAFSFRWLSYHCTYCYSTLVYTILSAIWLTGCQLSRSARNILSIKDLLLFFLVPIEEKTLVLLSHLLGQRPLSFLLVVVATITLNLVELSYLIADFFLACFIFIGST
jgi:hypothetical protein